jgi:hypothetical protein
MQYAPTWDYKFSRLIFSLSTSDRPLMALIGATVFGHVEIASLV